MENINLFIVFIEGVLSIFSPCILPILPIYLSVLSNSNQIEEIEKAEFKRGTLVINTLFFTLGISTTFFILGSSLHALSSFFNTNKYLIQLIGGMLILFMGLFYLGVIRLDVLNREKRLHIKPKTMSPLTALVLGFTFSLGWTPCIGPILASVLIMASNSESTTAALFLIGVYTIGFIAPFILTALFYHKLFKQFDKVKAQMLWIKRISGAFILIAGALMVFTGVTNISKQLKVNTPDVASESINSEQAQGEENQQGESQEEAPKISPIAFTLYDQYGEMHTLSDYKGKAIFLNFWATWCPPCRGEMPDIEALYQEYNQNQEDVIILGIASPDVGREGSEEHIKSFLEEEGYTFPVVFDKEGSMLYQYGINSFPSTLIINKEGYITQYIPGAMDKETMKKFIEKER